MQLPRPSIVILAESSSAVGVDAEVGRSEGCGLLAFSRTRTQR